MTARAAIWVSIALWANAVAASAAPSDGLSFERVVIPADVPAHLCSALTEDLQGFVWIGTQAGLVRYDGYQFRVHEFDPKDPHSLAGNYVRSLFAASDGRLWVGTFSSGLSAYDPTTERFERYQHSPTDPSSLAHNRVEGIAEDRSGRLWIATFEGLDRLDPRSGRLEHFRHDPKNPTSLAANRVHAVLVEVHLSQALEAAAQQLTYRAPTLELISNLTGARAGRAG